MLARWALLRTVIVTILVAAASHAIAQAPLLSVPAGEHHAAPRETITVMARLENPGSEAVNAQVEAAVPAGWRLLLPLPQVSLAAGATQLLPVPLLLPEHAEAGQHELELTVTASTGSTSQRVTVTVARVQEIDAIVDSAPSDSLPNAYEVTFRLTNRGNQPESLELAVQSNRGLNVTMEQASLTLEPGASAPVRVSVPELPNLERPVQHVLTLIATPEDGDPVRVTSATNVIAMSQPAHLAYHTFPIRLGLTLENGADGFSVRRLEARGQGSLTEHGDTDISFHVRYSPRKSEQKYELSVSTPTWTVQLGKQKQDLGPHLQAADGSGISLQLQTGTLNASIFGLITGDGPQAGFSLTPPSLWGATFTARGAFGTERAILALNGLFPTGLGTNGQFALELEPSLDLLSLAGAVHAEATVTGSNHRLSGSFTHAAGGYDGISAPRTDFGVNARLRFTPNFRLDAGYNGLVHGQRVAHRSTLNLQATTGALRWGIRYRHQTDTREAAPKNEHSVTFSARINPTPGSSLSGALTWTSRIATGNRAARDLLRLDLTGSTPLGGGTLSATSRTEYDLTSKRFTTALLGATWNGALTDSTTLQLELDHNLTGNRATRFRTGVTHDFANGTRATTSLAARTALNSPVNVTAALSFDIPVDLRLTRRAGVTAVTGTLHDQDGTGLSGRIIHLAGFTAVTGEHGTFHFPAVPAGDQVLFISGLEPNQVTQPALPLRVAVPRDEPLVITVTESATIRGTVQVQEVDRNATGQGVVEANNGTALHASGLRILLTGEHNQREILTDSQGNFEAAGLTPGTWQVTLNPASIPNGYEASKGEQTVTVRPGETAQLELRVVPVRRDIRFTGGGDLED